MEITPFSQPWIEGFVSEAADMGLTPEQADQLLKQASFMALMRDGNFAAGFNEEMQKAALNVNVPVGAIAKSMIKWTPAVATGALGLYGLREGSNWWQRNVGVGPENRGIIEAMQYRPNDVEGIANMIKTKDRNARLKHFQDLYNRYTEAQGDQAMMEGMRPNRNYSPFGGFSYRP